MYHCCYRGKLLSVRGTPYQDPDLHIMVKNVCVCFQFKWKADHQSNTCMSVGQQRMDIS